MVDGDTVDVSTDETVRIIGIDTPERGECGFDEAAAHLASIVEGRTVELVAGARDDTDAYDRLLRYVDTSDGVDVGLALIEAQLAISRYDSRDGHGTHRREDSYVAADKRTIAGCSTIPGQSPPTTQAPAAGNGGVDSGCDPSYELCIPPYRPDLDGGDIGMSVRVVGPSDPHGLDREGDDRGWESYG